jgi:signal transduction histidine kinase
MDKILYLDDQPSNLAVFQVCFQDVFEIYLAKNSEEARRILADNTIKVLLADHRMPDIEGLDFIKHVKKRYPQIVCILVTAYPDRELLLSAINEVDLFRFIIKPWNELDLKLAIIRAVEYYNARQNEQALLNELQKALKKAERSELLKSTFLTNLSHEIRTPLNCIMGITNMLSQDLIDVDEFKAFGREVTDAGDDLIRVIEDLICASKIEAGTEEMVNSEFKLSSFFSSIQDEFSRSALRKGLSLSLTLPANAHQLEIIADKNKLHEVFRQLLRNAIKFTHEGSIKYGLLDAGECTFYVKDTGVGIDEAKQNEVYKLFRKINGKAKEHIDRGNGLGLYIAKKLIRLAKGDIWFESLCSAGTTFSFKFPFNVVNAPIYEKGGSG